MVAPSEAMWTTRHEVSEPCGNADNIVGMERRLSAAPSAVEQLRGWFGENIEPMRIGRRSGLK